MIPRDRFQAALEGEETDRVPLFYQHLGAAKWLLQDTGLRWYDGFHDPDIFSKLALASYRMYGFDNVMAGWGDILIEAQAHGMVWKWPERDFYPRVDRYVELSEVDKLTPVDPRKDRFWSVPLRAASIMMDEVGKEVAVVGCINSPAVIASELFGLENVMMTYFTDPDVTAKALGVLTESSRAYGEALREIGVEEVFIENGTAGGEMVSLEQYAQFDGKYMHETVRSYRENGLRTICHNCAARPFWSTQMEYGPTAIHLHLKYVDPAEVFDAVRGKACMIAGIDHAELLQSGTPDQVEKTVKGTLDQWGPGPGIIVGPGCEMGYKTPVENIKRLRDSVERYGRRVRE
ncbi:MAG: uroporphyrinogen decarboxylase family protein [Methanomassiliicoccus sp.]|nr:uroporphyrinogen decarboxylase family protein [Methanomassiliicoccus sp.]